MTTNLVKNILKVMSQGDRPFYASDLDLNGGEINGLSDNRYIKPTGNTKTIMVPISTWGSDRIFKECKVKEWQAASPAESLSKFVDDSERLDELVADYAETLAKAIAQAREIVARANALGL